MWWYILIPVIMILVTAIMYVLGGRKTGIETREKLHRYGKKY